jgi:hypothetical protein
MLYERDGQLQRPRHVGDDLEVSLHSNKTEISPQQYSGGSGTASRFCRSGSGFESLSISTKCKAKLYFFGFLDNLYRYRIVESSVAGRVADPDWIRIQLGQWIRIQEGNKTHKSRKNCKSSCFQVLDGLFVGLFNFWSLKPWIWIGSGLVFSLKCWIRIRMK